MIFKIIDFFVWFQKLQQKLGLEVRVGLFYSRTLQVSFWNIETSATGNCACIALVQLSEMAIVEKENFSSFLRAKLNDTNFYQQLLARVCWKKREQFVWTWKGIPNNCYYPKNRAKHKVLRIYCFAQILSKKKNNNNNNNNKYI